MENTDGVSCRAHETVFVPTSHCMSRIHAVYRPCTRGLVYNELYCTDEITEHRDNGTQTTFSWREAVDYRDVDQRKDSVRYHGDDFGAKSLLKVIHLVA